MRQSRIGIMALITFLTIFSFYFQTVDGGGVGDALAATAEFSDEPGHEKQQVKHVTQEERQAAADRAQVLGLGDIPQPAAFDPQGIPDYFGNIPNYANTQQPSYNPLLLASDHYWTWYDSASMKNWVLMASSSGSSFMKFRLTIGGANKTLADAYGLGGGVVPGGEIFTYTEPGLVGGLVKVSTSLTGSEAVISQRSLLGNSFEEVPSAESGKLSDHFFWSWYDERSTGYQNWVLVVNPSTTETVHALITYTNIDNGLQETLGESDIAPGQSWTPHFPGKMGGPVEVKVSKAGSTWPTDPRDVIASQRVLSDNGKAFNELPGIPASELSDHYLWTWYDMKTTGFKNWVLLANPDTINPVTYEIKIGGVVQPCPGGGCTIPAGSIVTPTFTGTMGGPVEVTASANIMASQRIIAGPSFGEVPGFPVSSLSNSYRWAWYDEKSPGVKNWILITNTDTANPVSYSIKIGGVVQACPAGGCTIPAGGTVTPRFPGVVDGPVEVAASGPVLASQRVLWNGYFNEVRGMAGVLSGTGVRKFVDSLPGLGEANANNLGQYMPVAVPDTTTYPGSDYYEIEIGEYEEQMNSDLEPTHLRGYMQTNSGDPAVGVYNYMGPIILAQQGQPVRVKFTNNLPTGDAGNLFLPVDTTLMGGGEGPAHDDGSPCDPDTDDCAMYTENRTAVHLHGGDTPWISDGTPWQWITPAGETTPYTEGVSHVDVPDMPDPGDGSLTNYYPNEFSARMLFYHDHAIAITRLNVYAGMAAGYLIRDAEEQQLVSDGVIPADEIPLVIQDRSYVPDDPQLMATDPTWDKAEWGEEGDLWFPHVYVPAQNPADPSGMNAMGRWHYGPWFHPPTNNLMFPPVPNPYYDPIEAPWQPDVMPATPNPSVAAESFMDTPIVNGTAYPYVEVDPKAYRFRVLNAANDRFFNLQLYKAKANAPDAVDPVTGAPALQMASGEVPMVPAVDNAGNPESWPTDGRPGGVPDPQAVGPSFIQIGNEGGILPAPVELPTLPVNWNTDPTTFNAGNVNQYTLLLGPAERADVIVDFSQYAGQTLILYNDAPAAFPALDPRYDYYTGAPNLTETGGVAATLPGYGSNIRTIMQIRVKDTAPANPFDLAALEAAFASTESTEGIYEATQDYPLVPQSGYDSAFNETLPGNSFVRIFDYFFTFFNGPLYDSVLSATVTDPGSGYTSAPTVEITGGGGSGATATATVGGGLVTGITIVTPGTGFDSAPTVTITGGGGSGATATANMKPAISVTSGGSGYSSEPTVTITGGGGSGATATAQIAAGAVTGITLTDRGDGYTSAPAVTITGGGGSGATAVAKGMTMYLQPKAIQDEMGEAFDPMYGRMSANLGVEIPFGSAGTQNFVLYGYIDPPTEIATNTITTEHIGTSSDGTQIWRITHNGVDTHTVHFHLVNVQLINRVAWDSAVSLPDANELGWKETVRVNPLEDTIVALRPVTPSLPFKVPDSIRPLDPTHPIGSTSGFSNVDTNGNPITVTNEMTNFGWEYVIHCHLLGHEENDMMRPFSIYVSPKAPSGLAAAENTPGTVTLDWTNNAVFPAADSFTIQRATDAGFTADVTTFPVDMPALTYDDATVAGGTTYYYRVRAENPVAYSSWSDPVSIGTA
ncbi:MAG: hypothetical protein ACYC1B_06625 [Thermoleophilia bacterium]